LGQRLTDAAVGSGDEDRSRVAHVGFAWKNQTNNYKTPGQQNLVSVAVAHHLSSMTGFARTNGHLGALSWVWETRSVNSKGLDIRLRLPPGFEHLDQPVREAVKKGFGRGSIYLQLAVETDSETGAWRLNEELVHELRRFAVIVDGEDGPPLSFADMVRVRGLVEPAAAQEVDQEAVDKAMLGDLATAISALGEARGKEGARLETVLSDQVSGLSDLVGQAKTIAGTQPAALRQRLKNQLAVIMEESDSLSEERLSQEVAVLATRADITEEIDRLDAHLAQARDFLGAKDPVGRRLDFLCQELNREANTVCSKSTDLELTRVGMALKAQIEQFREQVQNIE
ncbi:MAG: YicC/YloC family endoribonuclease, partial [Pseudomonadota bacterium]